MIKTKKRVFKVPVKNPGVNNKIAIVNYKGKFTKDKIRYLIQNLSNKMRYHEGTVQASIKYGKNFPGLSWKNGISTLFGDEVHLPTHGSQYGDEVYDEIEEPRYFSEFNIIIMKNK